MIPREAEQLLRLYATQFRAVAVVGPRQSGKTTLVRSVFAQKPYVSLENPDERLLATSDPRAFLGRYRDGAVIDEAQRVPELFSYLQQILDESRRDGMFILTGSNNFLLQQSVTQSLAGRIAYVDLLPLSYSELLSVNAQDRSTNKIILDGFYPELHDRKRKPELWYPAYIRTYVERDVKQLRNIENTVLFTRFLQLCAGRVAQQLSISALSNECGIDLKTAQAWLSILQSSYVVHLIQPHQRNFNKRVVKTPKLYFTDTGLVCSLLGIRKEEELQNSHFRGALFENLVVGEILKQKYNSGSSSQVYYWRDNKGVEIDLVIDSGSKLYPIEIKSSQTSQDQHFKSLRLWNKYSDTEGGTVLYDGGQEFVTSSAHVVANWRSMKRVLTECW